MIDGDGLILTVGKRDSKRPLAGWRGEREREREVGGERGGMEKKYFLWGKNGVATIPCPVPSRGTGSGTGRGGGFGKTRPLKIYEKFMKMLTRKKKFY